MRRAAGFSMFALALALCPMVGGRRIADAGELLCDKGRVRAGAEERALWKLSGLARYSDSLRSADRGRVVLDEGEEATRRLALWPLNRLAIGGDQAWQTLDAADVIVVCDDHRIDRCRQVLSDLIDRYGKQPEFAQDALAVGLEALSADREWPGVPDRDSCQDLVRRLAERSPWPCAAYLQVFQAAARYKARLMPLGFYGEYRDQNSIRALGASVSGAGGIPSEVRKQHLAHTRTKVTRAVGTWRETGAAGRSRLLVLYGADHVIGSGNLVEALEVLGLSVVRVAPCHVPFELAIWNRFGGPESSRWLEPAPGLLRPSGLNASHILTVPWPRELTSGAASASQMARLQHALADAPSTFESTVADVAREIGGERSISAFTAGCRRRFPAETDTLMRRRLVTAAAEMIQWNPEDSLMLICLGLRDRATTVRNRAAWAAREVDARLEPVRSALWATVLPERGPVPRFLSTSLVLALGGTLGTDPRIPARLIQELRSRVGTDAGAARELIAQIGMYGYRSATAIPVLERIQASSDASLGDEAGAAIRFIRRDAELAIGR